MAIIELNYQDTINKAGQMADLASDIRSICNRDIEEINDACSSIWKGDSGVAYQKKLNQIQTKIEKRARNIENTANSLGGVARRLKQAEDYAKSLLHIG